ncbi:MAG: FAD-dependent oxidoreductase, partial [Pseudomonadota bacterium]
MEPISLQINGAAVQAQPGQTILDVVRAQHLDEIPTLCHAPELPPQGSCFLCVVEVQGRPNLLPSCATRVAPGMVVQTRNARILASRKTALELLLSNHYADCLSPCRLACPAGVDVQGYLALTAQGQQRRALDLIRKRNPLPAVCGRVCVRRCEEVCRRGVVDAPVGINAVKRHLADQPGAYDGAPECAPSKGQSVGIVGAGPAGLTAAYFLGRMGFLPVLYEAMPRAGGMLRYGIPAYRLPDDVLDAEIGWIAKAGAVIHTGVRVGAELPLAALRADHDALFLAAGAWAGKPMGIPGEAEAEGVVSGIDLLRALASSPRPVRGTVAVVGGGNTAMDVARTALRLGAEKVLLVYRRTRAEMPADPMEIRDALEEGIELLELVAPVGLAAVDGQHQALRCVRMVLGEPDPSGRRRPVPLHGSEFDLPCDLCVSAIGQGPLLDGLTVLDDDQVALTRWRTFQTRPGTQATSVPGVFAGGDAADDGPTVVVDAIRDGRRAALAIAAWLTGEALEKAPFTARKDLWGTPGRGDLGEVRESPRHEVAQLPLEQRRGSFAEVATGFDPEDAAHECDRCLACGCVKADDCDLRRYADEYGVDLERFVGTVRRHRVDDRHPHIVYDPNKCVLCARCIRTCARVLPIPALGLVGRGFRAEMRPAMGDPLAETNCVDCGACVEACPTGALTFKHPFPGRASLPAKTTVTACGFCSLACTTKVLDFGAERLEVRSSGAPSATICRTGRYGHELYARHPRLRAPLIRTSGSPREVGLEEACARAAAGLRAVAARWNPGAVAVFVSPELTNEELYLAGRIAREGLGSANIGSLTALGTGLEADALDPILGTTASTAGAEALRGADLVICNNTSMEGDHLPLAAGVIAAVRAGARLVVCNATLDPADRALASVTLDPLRGRAGALWKAVIQALLASHWPRDSVAALPGGAGFLAFLAEEAADSGVAPARERAVADLLAQARRVVLIHGIDRAEDQAPGDLTLLGDLVVLLRATGAQADLLLPRRAANGAGLAVCGADPRFRPGLRPAPPLPGAHSRAELADRVAQGRVRGALILGEDPLNDPHSAAGLADLSFLAVMDWTPTETTHDADVVLPGCPFPEAAGTRCAFDGRVVAFQPVLRPPAGYPGWRVLAGLVRALGLQVPDDLSALQDEVAAAARASLGPWAPFHWNQGEPRPAP